MGKNKYGGTNDMPVGWTQIALNKRVYRLWYDIMRRCYDEGQQKRGKGKSYENCSVCERWFFLSNFYSDIQKLSGYKDWVIGKNMSIDKDFLSCGKKEYSPETCCFVPISVNISEKNRRNPTVQFAQKANKVKYFLTRGTERLIFQSEREACEKIGVKKCSIASCYRRGCKCKGYDIERVGAKMDKEADMPDEYEIQTFMDKTKCDRETAIESLKFLERSLNPSGNVSYTLSRDNFSVIKVTKTYPSRWVKVPIEVKTTGSYSRCCPQCIEPIDDGWTYCPYCGTKLKGAT